MLVNIWGIAEQLRSELIRTFCIELKSYRTNKVLPKTTGLGKLNKDDNGLLPVPPLFRPIAQACRAALPPA